MFPLIKRQIGGFAFGQKYPASFGSLAGSPHLGVDYVADNNNLFAPMDGFIKRMDGKQGGITLWFYPKGQLPVIRFMHLSEVKKTGNVTAGELIAITGNSGSASSGPHLHIDISNTDQGSFWNNFSNFIDPEKFNWESEIFMTYELFGERSTGRVFERHCDYSLTHIPTEDFGFKYYGRNFWNLIQWVDDITTVGWIAVDVKAAYDGLKNLPPKVVIETVKEEVNVLTDEERRQVIEQYEKDHPQIAKIEKVEIEVPVEPTEKMMWEFIGKRLSEYWNQVKEKILKKRG